MQSAGDFIDWVNMWLADNVPADDNDSELQPHDSVSDVEMTVSRTSSSFGNGREWSIIHLIQFKLRQRQRRFKLLLVFRGKKHEFEELAKQDEIAASTAKSAVRLSNDGHCAVTTWWDKDGCNIIEKNYWCDLLNLNPNQRLQDTNTDLSLRQEDGMMHKLFTSEITTKSSRFQTHGAAALLMDHRPSMHWCNSKSSTNKRNSSFW